MASVLFWQMAKNEKFITLHDVKIESMWGLCAGSYVYEGCSNLLSDGRPCALGKHKRRLSRQDPESPMGPHSRLRSAHKCSLDGAGTYMYCFAVQIGDDVIQVNEDNGMKLMGMSRQEFKAKVDSSPGKVKSLCAQVMCVLWTISFVKDDHDVCRALSVANPECKSSVKQEANEDGSTEVFLSPNKKDTSRGTGNVGRLRVLCSASVDFSGELVESLKSFSIRTEE